MNVGEVKYLPHSCEVNTYLSEMPAKKQVRFSRTTTVHAPQTPPTPTLSLGSSPRSSSGPLTPPSPFSMGLPGPTPYTVPYNVKASSSSSIVHLHSLLQFSHSPILNWDLTLPPSTISTHRRGLSRQTLAEPATSPPLAKMAFRSPHLPWTIKAVASRDVFVSVGDVIDAIYGTLRVNVLPQEFHSLANPRDARRVTSAYEDRYRRIPPSKQHDVEKRGGVKRVDFLMGHNIFTGFSSTTRGPDVWALNTS